MAKKDLEKDELEKAYERHAKSLRELADFPSSKREKSSKDKDDSTIIHYGQESDERKASIPTKKWDTWESNFPSDKKNKINDTDSELYNKEADEEEKKARFERIKSYLKNKKYLEE